MERFACSFVAPDGTFLTALSALFGDVLNADWVQGNRAVGSDDGSNITALSGLSIADDQWAEVIFGALDGVVYCGPCVRCGAPGSGNGYAYLANNPLGSFLLRYAGGAFSVLATDSQVPNPGDTLYLSAVGSVVAPYLNGVIATMGSAVDGTYSAGVPGLGSFRSSPDTGMVSFRAGDFLVAGAGSAMMLTWIPGL